MPFEIDLGQRLVGFALSSARKGEMAPFVYREFTSTEDGQYFIARLESLPASIIDEAPLPTSRSQVDNLLAILRRDGGTTVYLNELPMDISVRVRGSVEKGADVYKDDIADIERLKLRVDIPDDAGFIFLFSVGWRKGLFFDFGPLRPEEEPREFDTSSVLGKAVAHVMFQERFAISDREWQTLMDEMWFPFAGIQNRTIARLLDHVRSGWKCDELLDDIVDEVGSAAANMLESWRTHAALSPHIDLLERAVERFLEDDSISCTSILIPRIEGIVRTYHDVSGSERSLRQDDLADLAVQAKVGNERSLLLPLRFRQYLYEVYFANFDLGSGDVPMSRHSVGHGVACASDFDQKSAVLAILVIHQLFYFLPADQPKGKCPGTLCSCGV